MDGGSTAARLLTIDHYWSLIKEKDAILGVGFLSAYTNKAFSILRRSDTDRFWLEDLGILGGVVVYMILSCILLNIFDAQRIWCMPFYLSVIYFVQNPPKTQKQ